MGITVSFDCENDVDTAVFLGIVYELIHLSYKNGYNASFSMRRLPDLLGMMSDVIADRLDEDYWRDDHGTPFQFEKEEYEALIRTLGWEQAERVIKVIPQHKPPNPTNQ